MNTFTELTPNMFLGPLEEALGTSLTPLVRNLPSYINRVYELQQNNGEGLVVKFYRPGRWTTQALEDEHAFMADCAEIDIPVILPLILSHGKTLGTLAGINFAVFPKKGGRQFDIESDQDWQRIGMLLGRLHNAGKKKSAPSRLTLSPRTITATYVEHLCHEVISPKWRDSFSSICNRILDTITPLFEGLETIRIHGDFHSGNILHRPGEGLMIIDFDDMMNGTGVQDFWLLLPDHYPSSAAQLTKLLEGYRQFREPEPKTAQLIEALRAMRLIYFTEWCAMQRDDARFQHTFPDWGSDTFWAKETRDLQTQFQNIVEAMHHV